MENKEDNIMEIKDENIVNFGKSLWTYGRIVLVNNGGKDEFCIITRNEDIEVDDIYVMQLSRHDYELMNPCVDQAESNRCNESSGSIARNTYKVIVLPEQINQDDISVMINVGDFVLVECYPLMEGPGQNGWMINNDVEGKTNKVNIHFEKT